jgi:hypothetical protein
VTGDLTTSHLRQLPGWVAPTAVGLAGVGLCASLLVVDPNQPGSYGLCPFRLLTGLDCPGCGTLRSIHAMLGGDLWRAVDHNLLTVVLLPVLVAVWLRWLTSSRSGRAQLPAAPTWFGYGVAVAALVFWFARNLPALAWLGSSAT